MKGACLCDAGCDNMTCCIVLINRDAPTAALPQLRQPLGREGSAAAQQAPQHQPAMPDQDAPVPMRGAAAGPAHAAAAASPA